MTDREVCEHFKLINQPCEECGTARNPLKEPEAGTVKPCIHPMEQEFIASDGPRCGQCFMDECWRSRDLIQSLTSQLQTSEESREAAEREKRELVDALEFYVPSAACLCLPGQWIKCRRCRHLELIADYRQPEERYEDR